MWGASIAGMLDVQAASAMNRTREQQKKLGVRPGGRTPDTLSISEQTDDYALFGPDRVKLITASWPPVPVAGVVGKPTRVVTMLRGLTIVNGEAWSVRIMPRSSIGYGKPGPPSGSDAPAFLMGRLHRRRCGGPCRTVGKGILGTHAQDFPSTCAAMQCSHSSRFVYPSPSSSLLGFAGSVRVR